MRYFKVFLLFAFFGACRQTNVNDSVASQQAAIEDQNEVKSLAMPLTFERFEGNKRIDLLTQQINIPDPQTQVHIIDVNPNFPLSSLSDSRYDVAFIEQGRLSYFATGISFSEGSYTFIYPQDEVFMLILKKGISLSDVKNDIDIDRIALSGLLEVNDMGMVRYVSNEHSLVKSSSWDSYFKMFQLEQALELNPSGLSRVFKKSIASGKENRFSQLDDQRSSSTTSAVDALQKLKIPQVQALPAVENLGKPISEKEMLQKTEREMFQKAYKEASLKIRLGPDGVPVNGRGNIKATGGEHLTPYKEKNENFILKRNPRNQIEIVREYYMLKRFAGDKSIAQASLVTAINADGNAELALRLQNLGETTLLDILRSRKLTDVEYSQLEQFILGTGEIMGAKNVVHGNFIPENIRVTLNKKGKIIGFVLMDFSMAKHLAETGISGPIEGTPGYLPSTLMWYEEIRENVYKPEFGSEIEKDRMIYVLAEAHAQAATLLAAKGLNVTDAVSFRDIKSLQKLLQNESPLLKDMMEQDPAKRLFFLPTCNCYLKQSDGATPPTFKVFDREKGTYKPGEYLFQPEGHKPMDLKEAMEYSYGIQPAS